MTEPQQAIDPKIQTRLGLACRHRSTSVKTTQPQNRGFLPCTGIKREDFQLDDQVVKRGRVVESKAEIKQKLEAAQLEIADLQQELEASKQAYQRLKQSQVEFELDAEKIRVPAMNQLTQSMRNDLALRARCRAQLEREITEEIILERASKLILDELERRPQ